MQGEGKSVRELCPTLEGRSPGAGQGRVGAAVAPTLNEKSCDPGSWPGVASSYGELARRPELELVVLAGNELAASWAPKAKTTARCSFQSGSCLTK